MPRIPIFFFEEEIKFKPKNKTGIREWLKATALTEGTKLGTVNYIFCNDGYLLNINRQYLNHDTYTDIVTFDNSDKEGIITGDIFISVERIRENAATFLTNETHELHRVMVHGLLHLIGYSDKSKSEKKLMTEKEDFYLAKVNF